jgi:REP element-mobilizing transposase RayT
MAVYSNDLVGPPGFRGLAPDLPIIRYERRLPHWRQEGASYFVTFRLADSLPVEKLAQLQQLRLAWERAHPAPQSESEWKSFVRQYTRRTEAWLDEGHGECVFRNPSLARLMKDALFHFQDTRYFLSCCVVMPNHCHVIVRPKSGFELEQILQSWKGYVARIVNQRLGRRGILWQEESYDRIIRDERHLYHAAQYIGCNPVKAGLNPEQCQLWIHPDWQSHGWTFQQP